jgi:hypothetical protein
MMLDACSVVRASVQDKAILARALVKTCLQSCRKLKSSSQSSSSLYTWTRIDGDVVFDYADIESLTGDIMLHQQSKQGMSHRLTTPWTKRLLLPCMNFHASSPPSGVAL